MKKSDKFLIRIFPICLIIVFIVIPNCASASWMKEKIEDIDKAGVIDSNIEDETDKVMNTGQKIAKTIGYGLATIMLIVIGIKYLLASPEGRAEYKKTLPPYIAGAILVYCAPTIVGWFSNGDSISAIGDNVNTEVGNVMTSGKSIVRTIGKGLATIMLIVIGIKYMTESPEGKADYKKSMFPYVIGALLVYCASTIVGWFEVENGNITSFAKNVEGEVNSVMPIIENTIGIIGTSVATIMLIVLGIKYMSESPEGKADYRKTAIPYVVGAIIVFAASNIITWLSGLGEGGLDNANDTVVSATTSVMGTIITAAEYIGVGTAILMIVILAIKYMTASPEGKVEVQKTATVYIIGAVVLFAASGILAIISSVAHLI